MAKMKVKDFCDKAIEVEKVLSLYQLGKFMNTKKNNKYLLCDCSGLIKGILWGYPKKGVYKGNGVPDINADTMISQCSQVSTRFNELPYGALVWMKGHVGIHVGNGICVESSPIWEDGIQCTFIRGSGYSNTRKLKERTWTKHGLFEQYVDYEMEQEQPVQNTYYMKYNGSSCKLDEILQTIGVPAPYYGHWRKRIPLAKKNAVESYIGTASQNMKLINLAKQGKLKKV